MVCPVCKSVSAEHYLTVKDHTVSQQLFDLNRCSDCGFLYTSNPPSETEIGKYYQSTDYISHTNSTEGWMNKTYQLVRDIAIQQKVKLLFKKTGKLNGVILDYGCGTGSFLSAMGKSGWKTSGIEPDGNARKIAHEQTGHEIFTPDHLQKFNFGEFDAITLWHVLEHVHKLEYTLDQFRRIMKPQGKLIIAVPNHTSWDASLYKQFWAAYDVPRHLYHFDPHSIDKLLSQFDFCLDEIKPMWFDAFYVSLLSEKYKTGKTAIFSALTKGLISNAHAMFHPGKCSSQIYVYSKIN